MVKMSLYCHSPESMNPPTCNEWFQKILPMYMEPSRPKPAVYIESESFFAYGYIQGLQIRKRQSKTTLTYCVFELPKCPHRQVVFHLHHNAQTVSTDENDLSKMTSAYVSDPCETRNTGGTGFGFEVRRQRRRAQVPLFKPECHRLRQRGSDDREFRPGVDNVGCNI